MSIFKRFYEDNKEILHLPKIKEFKGNVQIIGSKSIANRAILLGSLSKGITILENVPNSDDVQILLKNLPLFGIEVLQKDKQYIIKGNPQFDFKDHYFYLENAGTALRPLVAVLSTFEGEFIIDGNEQMRNRPIKDLTDALESLGVIIETSSKGTPPVKIKKGGWKKDQVYISGKTSSQFISALLMASPLSGKNIEIFVTDEIVSKPYIDMTINLMKKFGIQVYQENYKYYKVFSEPYKTPGKFFIEGDATAATYFFTAGLLSGPVGVEGLNKHSIQGDIHFLEILEKIGAEVEYLENKIIVRNQKEIDGISIDMNSMPDAAMTLAVIGLFAKSPVEILNVENLRVKESERIKGLAKELQKFDAIVEEKRDGIKIFPTNKIKKPVRIETYKDHRMAMAFSLTAFLQEIEIIDPDCAKKTYPNFFEDFEKICYI